MIRRALLGSLFALSATVSGCVTTPATDAGGASTYSVGDRGQVSFEEVVVSVVMRGSNEPYQNLHISLTGFVNPRRKTAAMPFEAQIILQRCESRTSARIIQAFADLGPKTFSDVPALQEIARASGQAVADDAMQHWEHGADHDVQIAVTGFYFTEASVGRFRIRQSSPILSDSYLCPAKIDNCAI